MSEGKVPDFGELYTTVQGVELSCKAIAPGLSLHDLVKEFSRAEAEALPEDSLSGNPSKWPVVRGVSAVADLLLKSIYSSAAAPEPPSPSPELREALEALRGLVWACDNVSGMGTVYALDRALPNARATLEKHRSILAKHKE
jgi:hypothetical protein